MQRLSLAFLLLSTTMAIGQDATARSIMEKALAAKPKAEKLRFYDLDWATNLAQARQRAKDEKRPIVFLWITNITAGCDFFTGHTWTSADHFRGSCLGNTTVQQALAPYIVTLWNGREPMDAPDDVQELLRQRRRTHQQSNILVLILNDQSKLVHSFDGMTDRHPAPIHEIKKRMPSYFIQELSKTVSLLGTLKAPASKPGELFLPIANDPAIRIYITLGANRQSHFQVPTVEAVSIDKTEKKSLRFSDQAQKLEAGVLKRWLAQMYPPAVMDGHGGMEKVSGTLTYTPAGENQTHRFATLRGVVRFELDNKTRITYQGPLDLVIRYPKSSQELDSVLGTLTRQIPRADMRGNTVENVPMSVAIESIPVSK